jgi:DNA-binding PadR family transcriptional regulator
MSTPATTKTDLLLLGLLLDRPMHGYELYQQIQSEGIDRWFNISAAGVYYSLRKLRDQGWVLESRQSSGGSSRKATYHLTDEGRNAFFTAMEAELASDEETCLEYDLVIYLLNRFPWQRAIPQLEKRQVILAQQSAAVQAAAVQAAAGERGDGRSPLVQAILDHKLRFLEMERTWLAELVQSIQEEGEPAGLEEEGRRGFMVLNGDLRDFHLPDLFHLIFSGRHSGTLTITDGADTRILTFEGGQPIYGALLQRGGPPTPVSSCSEVMEGLCELFRWQEGRFAFDQHLQPPEGSVHLECSSEELILRGCRKVDDWSIIQELVPSADTIFEVGPGHDRLERLALTPTEADVVAAVDGVKDVATIARELVLTLFETSRALYCMTAIGVLRTADLDKIHLRRVFREIAELMCKSTLAWRSSPDDRSCEEEVNHRSHELPIRLNDGRIEDQADPQLAMEELKEIYGQFLENQYTVIDRRFGQSNARQAFARSVQQLPPELRGVVRRYGFDRIVEA